MDALECLLSRSATGALQEPAPEAAELQLILKAAGRAPDHGALKPWRFLIIQQNLLPALGQIFADSAQAMTPDLSETQLQRFRAMPLRAPLMLIAYAKPIEHAKVSAADQLYAVAAACQNALLAAHALGYSGIWRTGELAQSSALKTRLGLQQQDEIIGFLYLGTAKSEPRKTDLSFDSERMVFWNAS